MLCLELFTSFTSIFLLFSVCCKPFRGPVISYVSVSSRNEHPTEVKLKAGLNKGVHVAFVTATSQQGKGSQLALLVVYLPIKTALWNFSSGAFISFQNEYLEMSSIPTWPSVQALPLMHGSPPLSPYQSAWLRA